MAADLVDIDAARAAVLERVSPPAAERLALREALGRVLAEDALAREPVPAFDNSAMDGFAVRALDTAAAHGGEPPSLRLVGESRAGRPAEAALGVGEAIRISTGAAIPAGADAVVRVEDTDERDGQVTVRAAVEAGRDVRRAGDDIEAGRTVLGAGTPIGPVELGVLASIGYATVACGRRPRVHVLTSGDELLEPDEPMRPGGVRNSGAYALPALAEACGAEVAAVGGLADEPAATRAAIAPALDGADVVVISGGVSVGPHDHIKDALAALGVERVFWRIALRPGKPAWFGTRGSTLVFGLPGNPVSSIVVFLLLVRPALRALAGAQPRRERTTARLARDCEQQPHRAQALRCRLELRPDGWRAHPTGPQGSHVLTSMLGADCLALIPAGGGTLRAGAPVEVELLPGRAHAAG